MKKYILVLLILVFGFDFSFAQDEKEVQIKIDRKSKGAWLGVLLKQENDDKVLIEKVIEDSPAFKAGIKSGDEIIKINKNEIDNPEEVVELVQSQKPDSKLEITILRDNVKKDFVVNLGFEPKEIEWTEKLNMHEPNLKMLGKPKMMLKKMIGEKHNSDLHLGLEIETLNKQLAEFFNAPDKKGVLVKSVHDGSSAFKSGFKAGDIIIKLGSDRIKNVNDITELLEDFKAGDKIEIEVLRNKSSKKLQVVLENNLTCNCEMEVEKKGNFQFFGNPGYKFHFDNNLDEKEVEILLDKSQENQIKTKEIKIKVIAL